VVSVVGGRPLFKVKHVKTASWVFLGLVIFVTAISVNPKPPRRQALDEIGLPPPPDDEMDLNEYNSVKVYKLHGFEPLIIIGPVTSDPVFKCPFKLVKVTPTAKLKKTYFLLQHKLGDKVWLQEGDDLYETVDDNSAQVGRIEEMMEDKQSDKVVYLVRLTYREKPYTLELEVAVDVDPIEAKKLSLHESLKEPGKLFKFEGKKLYEDKHEYLLNKDFFKAMIANGPAEIEKLGFLLEDPLKIDSLGAQSVLRKFGLQEGDKIESFGGRKIKSESQINKVFLAWKADQGNDKAGFTVKRDGKIVEYKFKILDNAGDFRDHFLK
jgi:hypothetical protein